MAEISKLDEAIYTEHDVVAHLRHTLAVLHRIGTTNVLLTEEEKQVMQYAHDCLQATCNELIDALPEQDTQAVIVPAKKGAMVRATSGLMFRNKVKVK